MNIPYMIFINACACAIVCAAIFGVRLIITHVFHGRKQWSNRPYWWTVWAFVMVLLTRFGVIGIALAILFGYMLYNKKLKSK